MGGPGKRRESSARQLDREAVDEVEPALDPAAGVLDGALRGGTRTGVEPDDRADRVVGGRRGGGTDRGAEQADDGDDQARSPGRLVATADVAPIALGRTNR